MAMYKTKNLQLYILRTALKPLIPPIRRTILFILTSGFHFHDFAHHIGRVAGHMRLVFPEN